MTYARAVVEPYKDPLQLNQPRCKSLAKIMEVKVRDLCGLERTDKPSTEVAAVQGSGRLTNEDDIVL